jgi:hypothetical protein
MKFERITKVEHADYQPIRRLLSKNVFTGLLIINHLQNFSQS